MQTTDLHSIPPFPAIGPAFFEFRKQLLQVLKVTQLKHGLKMHVWQLCLLQRAVSGTGGSFGRLAGDLVSQECSGSPDLHGKKDGKWQEFWTLQVYQARPKVCLLKGSISRRKQTAWIMVLGCLQIHWTLNSMQINLQSIRIRASSLDVEVILSHKKVMKLTTSVPQESEAPTQGFCLTGWSTLQ